ncbi:hypothetical protein IHC92_18160 [Photobacterium damselae subsp. damselae]|uniref:hypothetical protein n=1 Tax=Photobacterium damselae TaxID=38293 RepID=UPI001F239E7A|nr:hypothetical protein [Photobacterium damselae]UJZ96490.1 hypothetical protein IHC87_18165 [Photobacterium damselae subsp. damselae]UJZ99606.1 hypothetical protein IHC88_19325 [Photobacterium damselae subsp. damselae]UKA08711.1 hypothetical protein IHC90_17020 [Photobacterium damselae subsp. damselae]UKA22894.1 hypothetical protein IHC92_18160 [Photobacterium damselae subsp. damselae]
MKKEKYDIGCFSVLVGFLSFIPIIGTIFALISIIWGLIKKSKTLIVMGSLGLLFTVIFIVYSNYNIFHKDIGYFSELRKKSAIDNLNNLVKGLEIYQKKYGKYPNDLQQLLAGLPEQPEYRDKVYDPTLVGPDGSLDKFHYELVNKKFYILVSKGFDGKLYTNDDIYPNSIDKSGLLTKAK